MADEINYELLPRELERDETDINLRGYFSRMSDAQLRQYDPAWTDEQTMEWDGNFRCDGALFLVCSERDVDVHEYRRVLAEHIALRQVQKL